MTKLLRDPQLEQLVRELNDSGAADSRSTEETPERRAESPPLHAGGDLEKLLIEMAQRGASDLLLVAGAPPVLRVGGRLALAGDALSGDEVQSLLAGVVTSKVRERIESEGAADFSLRLAHDENDRRAWRFRVNVHRQRGMLAAAVRALPTEVPTIEQLRLPSSLAELVKPRRGLVLVCGPTGSGKSTTLAALVGEINRTEARHVITIEDPVEYEHRNQKSIIEQIEVGRDTPSFAAALRASLRQDPDVILVGEMRDLETVATALTAAETGHLILSTLHTSDAASAIHRVVDVFPPTQQTQIKQQLALSLNAIIVQHLVPRTDESGSVVAVELLHATYGVRNQIRNDRLQNLSQEITLGKRHGMITLEESLARLVQEGLIALDDARVRSARPEELESLLRR